MFLSKNETTKQVLNGLSLLVFSCLFVNLGSKVEREKNESMTKNKVDFLMKMEICNYFLFDHRILHLELHHSNHSATTAGYLQLL